MEKIYCKKCNLFLGELATGSRIRVDVTHICNKCYQQLTDAIMQKDFADIKDNRNNNIFSKDQNIFDFFNKEVFK